MSHSHGPNQICPKCGHEFSLTEKLAKEIEKDVEKRISKEFEKEKARLKEEATKAVALELTDLSSQIKERDKKIEEATKFELELRRKTRELEDKEKRFELEMQRKIDGERKKLEEDASKRLSEQFSLKLKEKELQLEGLQKQIEEWKRKSEQGSQQLQGEALELEFEDQLRVRFAVDLIEPVGKGVRGADIIQTIRNQRGEDAGKLLHEFKNTKNWNDGWIKKAKEDLREAKADLIVLVSEKLPEGITGFGFYEGIYVTNPRNFLNLTEALRIQIIDVARARNASTGRGEKLDSLYRYISQNEFRLRVEAIIDCFSELREMHNKEKISMQRSWAAREKAIERVMLNTAGMYGDLQGILGASLPRIDVLELGSVPLLEAPKSKE